MKNFSDIILKNNIIYYISAAMMCLQGLLCVSQISGGAGMIRSVSEIMWYSESPGAMILWGIFTILAGLVMLAGFLLSGVAAFAKQKVLVGIGAVVLAMSYVLSILRESVGAYLYAGVGFIFLNFIGLALLILMAITVFADAKPFRTFVTEYTPAAMLIPIGLFLLTIIVAGFGHGLSAGTFFYNLAENLAQVGMIVVIGRLTIEEDVQRHSEEGDVKVNGNEGYRNVLLVVVFSVITCGIYMFYWVYKVSDKINRELMTGKSAGAQTALFIFVPFYSWYWIYVTTQGINEYGFRRGKPVDSAMAPVNLVVTIIGLMIVAVALMQDMLNKAITGVVGYAPNRGYYRNYTSEGQKEEASEEKYAYGSKGTAAQETTDRVYSNKGGTHVGEGYYYKGRSQSPVERQEYQDYSDE